MFTRQSYLDAYCLYIDRCAKENWENDIDPHHCKLEWNHLLPKSVFGDWPIGHWLTLRQHAVASALQSLAFDSNCMCGWHKEYLPETLLEKAWPIYRQASEGKGKNYGHKGSAKPPKSVTVIMKDESLLVFPSVNDAARNLNLNSSSLSRVCLGKLRHTAGFRAYFTGEECNDHMPSASNEAKPVVASDQSGHIYMFPSVSDASRALGIDPRWISAVCRGKKLSAKGYRFSFAAMHRM